MNTRKNRIRDALARLLGRPCCACRENYYELIYTQGQLKATFEAAKTVADQLRAAEKEVVQLRQQLREKR